MPADLHDLLAEGYDMSGNQELGWHLKYMDTVRELHQMRNALDSMQAQRDALLTLAEGQARALDAIQKWKKEMPE